MPLPTNMMAGCQTHIWNVQLLQGSGDVIFVPSGWHHTVENLEDTLSINHNWLNGHNIEKVWQLLQREGAEAAAAIEDIRFEDPQSTSRGVLSVNSRNMDASLAARALPAYLSMFMHHLGLQRNSIMSILAVAGIAW